MTTSNVSSRNRLTNISLNISEKAFSSPAQSCDITDQIKFDQYIHLYFRTYNIPLIPNFEKDTTSALIILLVVGYKIKYSYMN